MAKFRLRSKITGQYIEITQEAIETPVEDMMGFFEGKDVETILSEIGLKIRNGVATPHDIDLVRKMLDAINDDILSLKDGVNGIVGIDTETLKEMVGKYEDGSLGSGGSGGGGEAGGIEGIDTDVLKELVQKYIDGTLIPPLVPTLESDFPERTVVEEGSGVTIDVFFQTPNLGDATLYININNAEIDFQPQLRAGANTITIKGSYLNKTNNVINMYAKDRVGMTTNQLTFTVVSGGVSFSTTFDHTVDYVVGQNILFPFTVTSEIEGEIILHRTIDGLPIEDLVCDRGYNSFNLNDFITGVGSHAVSMYATVGTYKSKVISFNVVIASSTQLSLSSSTLNGTQFTYGEAIQISYRVSKLGNEAFTMKFYIDDELMRTASVSTGSYIWTIAAGVVQVGKRVVKITAEGTTGDSAEITVEIEIVKGAFDPIEIIKGGMSLYLDSDGYSNEMNEKTIWVDRSGKNNHAELIGFNFKTNGWNPTINEVEPSADGTQSIVKTVEYKGLVCNNDAYVRIPYKPFYNNVINGFTMELLYTPEHSGNNLARVLEYVDHDAPYVGVYANIDESYIKSESQIEAGQVDLDYESGEIQLDFVIDRDKKLCIIYIDGICTRYWSLSDSGNVKESFAIDQDYIYLNFSALDPNYCGGTNVIRKFICYERPLSHAEIENNWIANAPDIIEMERRYNWCYNTQIAKLQIYGDISNISSSVPAYVRIKYISPDESKYGASFDLESANSPIYLQGTSSLGYSRKNYRFILIDNNGQQYFHEMFPGNALPESTYTAKCDYVDSSMACNVSLCKIANDTLYGPNFTDAQRDNPRRRTATYGHAIELVNIVNNKEISLGAYTLIIDRYAEESMGYKQSEYPNILVLEGESNSDIGASAFYAWSESHPLRPQFPLEVSYYNEGFRVVYPPTNEAAYDFADIRELVKFIDESSDDDFKDTFESYFSKESVIKYYLFCLCFASVDTLSKNLHLVRYNNLWYILPYDCDSVLGGSNKGFLNISSSCEVGDVYDEEDPTLIVEPNQFNSWNGRLWARMRDTFGADLKSMWTTLRSNGTFNYDNFIKYFDEIWDAIPPSMYNSSQQIKYINYGEEGQVAMHGNRKHQIKKFLRERIAYLDSKFEFYSDGGAENYANIRMNVIGDVSLTIETYYPVYYTVKWATNNIETHRIAKNTKKTFRYFSDVSTDREVLLYLPHTLKTIENLDSLQPASIDINKAVNLTSIQVHSKKLYSVSLNNNKYLRTIDFNGCELLGTDTVSTMSILYAKYLKYLDVRGTKLTAVNFSPQGGSLVDCYLPETITSLTMKHQLLLKNLILPSGDNAAKELASVEIDNCPEIIRMSEDETKSQFDVFKYCRSLIINNSFLTMNKIVFDGFTRLQTISLSNMESLTDLGLNDLCIAGEESTLRYIGMSACKNLTNLALNCTSDKYEIAFANRSLLDLSTSNVTELSSNCVIKGLETIVLPVCIENMYFTKEFGSGYSDIKNIWSAGSAVIDTSGVFPVARHMNFNTNLVDEYEGIDFYGLHLYNIDLGALVNIPDAINFSLYPTSVNPNFNLNRDGVEVPFLQPSGVLDLSDYTESLAKFFNGVNLDKLYVACRNDLPQTDLSYCFYGSSFSSPTRLNNVLNHITTVSNMEYCFYGTSTSNIDVLNSVNFLAGTSLRHCFAGCPNITELSNVTLSSNIGDASYMFSGSGLRSINNVSTSCGTIIGMFSNCDNLVEVNDFTASATTSYESLFEGCGGMTAAPIVEIPNTIINISKMYKGCNSLVSIDGLVLHKNITNATEFIAGCNNLINANDVTIAGPFYNDIFRGITSIKYVNNLLISYVGRSMSFAHMFDGCSGLVEMSFHDDSYVKDVISMDYMFAGTSMRTVDFSNVNFEKVTSLKYMFANGVMDEFSYTVPITIMSIQGFLSGCSKLKTLRNFNVPTNVSALDWLADTNVENLIDCSFNTQYTKFTDNTSLKVVENLEYTGTDISNYFSGCTSLERASLVLTNKTTKAESTFANCPNLVQIDFKNSDLSNVTSINGMFNGDTSLTTINNLKIVKSSTTADNTTLVGCPISNTDGLYINSNNALDMFRLGAESAITAVTDFELGSNANDLSELFMNNPNITHDIVIPSHVYSVEKMYYNCGNLTYVTSNWSNIYDLNVDANPNNDVVTADCYGECTNIQFIDDELYMNEYGELTAIYSIPEEWGGILNCSADQTAFYINSDLLTEYTITLNGSDGVYTTEWGDGTTDKRRSHTYSKSGSFRIVTNNSETFGTGNQIPDNFRTAITRVLHLAETITNGANLFKGCSNLLSVKPFTNTFNTAHMMFESCESIINIDLSQCTISNSCIYMYNMFKYCSNLETVKLPDIPPSVTNLQEFFCYCTKLKSVTPLQIPDACTTIDGLFTLCVSLEDINGFTFGSGITRANSWIPTNLKYANNVTIKNNVVNFNECSTLVSAKNFKFDGINCDRMFRNCTNLEDVSGLVLTQPLHIGSVSNGYGMFAGCKSIKIVDFSNSDLSKVVNINNLFQYCDQLKEVIGLRIASTINLNLYTRLFSRYGASVGVKLTNFILEKNGFVFSKATDTNLKRSDLAIGELDGVTIANNVTDISGLLDGAYLLIHDFEIPSHITNCTNCFKDCTSMTHVHSNWNNAYTNGITSTDCYAGCTAITHIDEDNVKAYDGDNGLDYVPTLWGGNGFTDELTGIYVFNIPSDNYALKFNGYTVDDGTIRVNWGDGSMSVELTHTYATAGTYTVKGKVWCSTHIPNGEGQGPDSSICNSLIKVLKVPQVTSPTSKYSLAGMFSGCKLLEWADISDAPMKDVFWARSAFNGCKKLKYANVSCGAVGKTDNYNGNAMNLYFNLCEELTEIVGLDAWNFTGLYKLDISNMFYGCLSLTSIDVTGWNMSGITNFYSMFKNCSSLASIIGIKNWVTSNVTNMNNMFSGCSNLTSLDLSSWNLSNCTNFGYMFNGCTKLITPPVTTFGNANKPTTNCNYPEIYGKCTFTAEGITFKVVGACNLYRAFVQCKRLDQTITFEWNTDQPVTVTGLFCEGTNVSVLGNFNLTSCVNLFNGFFFGGIGSQTNKNLTTFNCYGVQTYDLNISIYPNLSKDSILNIINRLCETTNALKLTLGSTNMAKLTDAEIAIATAKGWTVV